MDVIFGAIIVPPVQVSEDVGVEDTGYLICLAFAFIITVYCVILIIEENK